MTVTAPDVTASPPTQKIPASAWVLLACLTMAWGSMWPLSKIALSEIPVMTMRSGAALLGGVVLLSVARLSGSRIRPVAGEFRKIAILSIFISFLWFYLSGVAVTLLPAGKATLLAYTMPFFTLIISVVFLKERVTAKRVIGVIAGLAAVFVLAWEDITVALSGDYPIGFLAILGAALAWSIGSVIQKTYNLQTPVAVFTGWVLIIGGTPLALLATQSESAAWVSTVSADALLAALSVILVSTALGTWCWSGILKRTDLGFSSIAVLTIPVMSQILSFILLGEVFDLTKMVGLGLILFGLSTILPLKGITKRMFG